MAPGNRYPALALALAVGVGIWVGKNTAASPALMLGAAALCAGAVVPLGRQRALISLAPLRATTALFLAVALLAAVHYRLWTTIPESHPVHLTGDAGRVDLLLEARIRSDPLTTPRGVRFVAEARSVDDGSRQLSAQGLVQVNVFQPRWGEEEPIPALRAGDVVQIPGRLRSPPGRRNPADFDYGAFLARKRVYAVFAATTPSAVEVVGHEPRPGSAVVAPMQRFVRAAIDRNVHGPREQAVLSALLLGDRSEVDAETREQFVVTGLMHLLAVSGLHVLLVGMVVYNLLRPLLARIGVTWRTADRWRAGLTLGLLLAYMFITGAGASVVRAVVMATLFISSSLLQRPGSTLNALGAAAIVLLAARPTFLFDVGFQLSFSAVGGIVLLNHQFERIVPKKVRRVPGVKWATGMVSVSLAATLATAPVLLYHFGRASFGGLLLNMPAIPLTAGTLSSGIAMVATAAVPGVASVFGAAAEVFAAGMLITAEHGAQTFGWASGQVYVTNPFVITAMVAALLAIAAWHLPRTRWRMVIASLGFATAGVLSSGVMRPPALEVLFFDVGQGDAALVRLPSGRHILIDAGISDGFSDSGKRVILPHLERFGIRRIDAVIASHPHTDHIGGLASVLRGVPVGRVIDNGLDYPARAYREAIHVIDSLGIPRQTARAGDTMHIDPNVSIHVLAPSDPNPGPSHANDASVVIRLTYGRTRILFKGDAEAHSERQMVERFGPLLPTEVVKAAHHGSATSSTIPFVRTFMPGSEPLVVVSVAQHNRYSLPRPEVIERWADQGARVVKTSREAAVWVRSDGEGITRVQW
jgi:competence protein ComEC